MRHSPLFSAITPRKLFLIDGLGALLSAIMLGLVLARFEAFFGVPARVLHLLTAVALAFFLNSMGCYFANRKSWQPWMKGIAIANLLYCLLTVILIIKLHEAITIWGLLYFGGEMLIVLALAGFEWRFVANND
ncbi:MAG: hypothetical protein R3B47_02205 [Bacteroidia bacterium]